MKNGLFSILFLFLCFSVSMNAQTINFKMDPAQSFLKWEGAKITGSTHAGVVNLKSGTVKVTDDMLDAQFTIDMESIVCTDIEDAESNADLVGHLKNEDFFDVANHPTATFQSMGSEMRLDDQGRPMGYYVFGSLTIKGITQTVEVAVQMNMASNKARFTGTINIDRTKWDIKYGSGSFFDDLGDRVINDIIKFEIDFTGTLVN